MTGFLEEGAVGRTDGGETVTDDDLPGGYRTVEGIKARSRALGSPIVAEAIETIEASIERDDDGYYSMDAVDVMTDEHGDAGTFFYIAVLTGCALEREYPGGGLVADRLREHLDAALEVEDAGEKDFHVRHALQYLEVDP